MFPQPIRPRAWTAARSLLAIAFCSILLASCGARKDMQTAEQAVGEFHSQLDSEDYQSIYDGTGDQFRKVTSESDFVALLEAVHKKLGKVQNARRQSFKINYDVTRGELIALEYATNFEGGSSSERFLFQMAGNRPLLLGYHINSNAFILK
jgi:hypothetical protein